jgi:hypothetical protein
MACQLIRHFFFMLLHSHLHAFLMFSNWKGLGMKQEQLENLQSMT